MRGVIREMKQEDRAAVIEMMRVFYASPAVHTDGSEEIFRRDLCACLSDSPYLEGYVFDDAGEILGYAMVAKSFSTEFGKPCIWIEDIYVREAYRSEGIGGAFFSFLFAKYDGSVFRLEAEAENTGAVRLYERSGFDVLPYLELIRT